jgi:hypothetical protein
MTLVKGMEEGRLHLLKLETSKGEVLIEPERWWIATSLL